MVVVASSGDLRGVTGVGGSLTLGSAQVSGQEHPKGFLCLETLGNPCPAQSTAEGGSEPVGALTLDSTLTHQGLLHSHSSSLTGKVKW